ncbi:hypothetical protein K402DRAFT_309050, partial [Aulographum hederae CBS 113979]
QHSALTNTHPVQEIESVVHLLTQSTPDLQRQTIEKYFTQNASFTHPFCRTGSFNGSRFLIASIFRWYKIMSPKIELEVNSVAYDPKTLTLYVNISQIFRIFLVPFYAAPVNLTTVLTLMHDKRDDRYYITSQNDLYQVDQFVRFFLFGGWLLVWLWQFVATAFCVVGAVVGWPVSWVEE